MKNGGDVENDGQNKDVTVYEYFTGHRNIELGESAYMPCLIVGRPKKPDYLPIEVHQFLLDLVFQILSLHSSFDMVF